MEAQQEIFVVGITKMHHGVCLGGVNLKTSSWVRPVKRFGELQIEDLTCRSGRSFQMGDVIALTIEGPRPDPPHTEDWVWDPQAFPAEFLRRPDEVERREILGAHCDQDPLAVLASCERSMCLARVPEIEASFGLHTHSGRFEARIAAPGLTDSAGFPCLDLRWRALGRVLTRERGLPDSFDDAQLRQRLGYDEIYLALGKGRLFESQYWPIIGAVSPVPDYHAEIDWDNLWR